jgi:hypothetical protein
MMLGAIGTPLVVFLSLELKLKPTWTLIFVTLTIFGGILRLGYALAFEESAPKNKPVAGEPESSPRIDGQETPLLEARHIPPGEWMKDTAYTNEEKAVLRRRTSPDKK